MSLYSVYYIPRSSYSTIGNFTLRPFLYPTSTLTQPLLYNTRIQWALDHIPGYSGPWTIYHDTVGPGPYTRIQWALDRIPGYSGPWTIYQETAGPEPYTRIQWALDYLPGYSEPWTIYQDTVGPEP